MIALALTLSLASHTPVYHAPKPPISLQKQAIEAIDCQFFVDEALDETDWTRAPAYLLVDCPETGDGDCIAIDNRLTRQRLAECKLTENTTKTVVCEKGGCDYDQ
jgi:hypothetical protein